MANSEEINSDSNGLNTQVIEAIEATNTLVIGVAPGESQAMTYEGLAHSLTLMMHNSNASHHAAQQVGTAAVAKTCANLLAVQ